MCLPLVELGMVVKSLDKLIEAVVSTQSTGHRFRFYGRMVVFKLLVKADLENVEELIPTDDTRWYMKFSCSQCGEKTDKMVYVTKKEEHNNPRGRGTTNLIYTCKFCKRESYVDIVPGSEKSYKESGSFQCVVEFDCRGVTPVEYEPRAGWIVKCVGTTFEEDVNLADDWADYDEEADNSVAVYGLVGKFVR
eukprot:TRINITY_DN8507_c0_g1_i2.p1 TRINITY_DN8507_c0_g1~~TRINITY_DN8507_c0_g1_i2.p1  ORF type:complete len:222 (-),score=50.34 TRINITY_DN8507_c0_g1_i2:193-768(-)